MAAGTSPPNSGEGVGRRGQWAVWSPPEAAVSLWSPALRRSPPASRCQRRSSSLPRFASERGYRPRPEEPPGPKEQFVSERVMREAQYSHPSRRHVQSHQHRKERSVPHSTHPSSPTGAKAPGTCIKMS